MSVLLPWQILFYRNNFFFFFWMQKGLQIWITLLMATKSQTKMKCIYIHKIIITEGSLKMRLDFTHFFFTDHYTCKNRGNFFRNYCTLNFMQTIRCCLLVHYVMCSMHALIIGSVRWQAIHAPVSLTSATLGPGARSLHVQAKALLFGILLHSTRTDYVPSSSTHFLFAHSFDKYTQRGFTLRV